MDLNHQDFSCVQSAQTGGAPGSTIASAATISPTNRFHKISGTVQIATINPPVSGYHELVLVFTNAAPGTLLTTGNILTAVVPTQNIPTILYYDPIQKKYYGAAGNLT